MGLPAANEPSIFIEAVRSAKNSFHMLIDDNMDYSTLMGFANFFARVAGVSDALATILISPTLMYISDFVPA